MSTCTVEEVASSCDAVRFLQLYVFHISWALLNSNCLSKLPVFFSTVSLAFASILWSWFRNLKLDLLSICKLIGIQEERCIGSDSAKSWTKWIQGYCFNCWYSKTWSKGSRHKKQVKISSSSICYMFIPLAVLWHKSFNGTRHWLIHENKISFLSGWWLHWFWM